MEVLIRTRFFFVILAVACGVAFLIQPGFAQRGIRTESAAVLTGQVTSSEEGPMEGVLVTAKKTDSTIAVTVVSDAQGRYRFPTAKLDAGHYAISIRAVGYDLHPPKSVDLTPPQPRTPVLQPRHPA